MYTFLYRHCSLAIDWVIPRVSEGYLVASIWMISPLNMMWSCLELVSYSTVITDFGPDYAAGLTECVLSGVMSVKGKKVLHIDRNDHYGGYVWNWYEDGAIVKKFQRSCLNQYRSCMVPQNPLILLSH